VQSLGVNDNEVLEINASKNQTTKFGENALVHPNVRQNIYSHGLSLPLGF